MATALQPAIDALGLGYDLLGGGGGGDFACVAAQVKRHLGAAGCEGVPEDGRIGAALLIHTNAVLSEEGASAALGGGAGQICQRDPRQEMWQDR